MQNKIDKFKELILNKENWLIVTHINPDPDAIASALALQHIVWESMGRKSLIVYGGMIGRPENKKLIELFDIKLSKAEEINWEDYDGIALVDTQLRAGNHPIPKGLKPSCIFDHHNPVPPEDESILLDVRPDYGATSTILTEYLISLGSPLDGRVATALFYGIKTDTKDLTRETSEADIKAYETLIPKLNRSALSQIENLKLSTEYFETLLVCVSNAFICEDLIFSYLGELTTPEMVPQMADFLLKVEGVLWSISYGFYEDSLYISLRSEDDTKDVSWAIKTLVGGRGIAGGHDTMAGGMIPHIRTEDREKVINQLENTLIQVLLEGKTELSLHPLLRRES